MMGKIAVHEEILELLPWIINESLGEKERELVMVHLAECLECREERDRLQRLEAFMREGDQVVPDYRFAYNKLRSRIDDAEKNRESTAGLDEGLDPRKWIPFAGIAAGLAFIMVIVGAFQPSAVPGTASSDFRTLTMQAQTTGASHRVALTFHQSAQALTMRQALIETHSNIVSGPDETGTYVIEVEIPQGMTRQEFLQMMRKIEGVQAARFSE